MKKMIARINKKTGVMTLSVEGCIGDSCIDLTKPIRDGLGMTGDPERTSEYFQEEASTDQQQGT